ncbi:uncharacterized protein LOC125780238, partial [Bactrocera dorsalis]|uniref:Uncharacterized protein LOC125780238 n=1 Tax=Bactrocera dorsalis TaxID=27457 RepID=A0ABM3K9E0_BACDO
MGLNCCLNMVGTARLLRLCLFLLLIITIVGADISTVERIRKHKEWLNQRKQQKSNRLALLVNHPKSNYEMANLWRYPKPGFETSANEVYPESEIVATDVQQQPPTTTTPTTSTLLITTTKGIETTSAGTTIGNSEVQTVLAATPTTAAAITTTTTATTTMQQPTTESINVLNETIKQKVPAVTTPTARGAGVPEAPIISHNVVTETPKIVVSTKATTVRTTTMTSTESSQSTAVGNVSDLTTSESSAVTSTKRPNAGPRQRPYPRWGTWGKWSDCSRSCGGGVRFQQRKCINRNSSTGKRYISNACIGVYRRYHVCNEQPCPAALADFRAVQCAAFNEVDFQGQKYTWEPYIKEDAECELNCKPKGMKYFATLNSSVIDGTPCFRPAEYYRSNYRQRAMCVEGVCKAVHATGI